MTNTLAGDIIRALASPADQSLCPERGPGPSARSHLAHGPTFLVSSRGPLTTKRKLFPSVTERLFQTWGLLSGSCYTKTEIPFLQTEQSVPCHPPGMEVQGLEAGASTQKSRGGAASSRCGVLSFLLLQWGQLPCEGM